MREYSPTSGPPPACRATKLSRRPQGRGVGVDGGALRWPWGGGSGEAQLGLGSGGREGWGVKARWYAGSLMARVALYGLNRAGWWSSLLGGEHSDAWV